MWKQHILLKYDKTKDPPIVRISIDKCNCSQGLYVHMFVHEKKRVPT